VLLFLLRSAKGHSVGEPRQSSSDSRMGEKERLEVKVGEGDVAKMNAMLRK